MKYGPIETNPRCLEGSKIEEEKKDLDRMQ